MSKYWKQTYSNGKYDFVENNPEDITLVDIAKALSQQVRFNGHLKRPLSVAQHSITVAAALSKDGFSDEVALQGLMHDAHEAYMGDFSSPYKRFLKDIHDVDINKIELPIKKAIRARFGIDVVHLPKVVEKYDAAVTRTEAESLFHRIVDNWVQDMPTMHKGINTVLGCVEAEDLFTKTFKRLGGKIDGSTTN